MTLENSSLSPEDWAAIEKKVAGGLKMTIKAHGPITEEMIGSAAKRVMGLVYGKRPT